MSSAPDADRRRKIADERFKNALSFLSASSDAPRVARAREEAARHRALETKRRQLMLSTVAVCVAMLVTAVVAGTFFGARVNAANARAQKMEADAAVIKRDANLRAQARRMCDAIHATGQPRRDIHDL